MRLADLPKFRSWGNYSLRVGWDDLKHQISRYKEDYNLNFDPVDNRGRVWTPKQPL